MTVVRGTATDTLAASVTDDLTLPVGGPTGVTRQRRHFFETRVVFGNPVEPPPYGPQLDVHDPYLGQRPIGPMTVGMRYKLGRDCDVVGMRVYKHPLATGNVQLLMYANPSGTLLASKALTWVVDDGGWREVQWDTPWAGEEGEYFDLALYYPTADDQIAMAYWIFHGSPDMYYHPFLAETWSTTTNKGAWNVVGPGPVWTNESTARKPSDYYLDPIAEWDDDGPQYTGPEYWDQFPNGPQNMDSRVFMGVWWVNSPRIADYKALGMTHILGDSASNSAYVAAIKAANIEWWPFLHENDMSAMALIQEDAQLDSLINGFFTTDEPEINRNPTYYPVDVKVWRDHARRLEPGRPHWVNLSRFAFENQSFIWQPTGITGFDANMQWREYAALSDVASVDAYSINASEPFQANISPSDQRFGIWTYPLQVRYSKNLVDGRCPVFGIVETTSSMPNKPTPVEVRKAVWAMFIAGAVGIEYFQHRFADADVSQDFASLVNDPVMSAGVAALNAEAQSFAGPILAPEANLIESYTSTGRLATAEGGLPAGAELPIHYTSRLHGGTSYLWCQSIRKGTTTATFFVPSLAGAVLTVVDEARFITVDGTGHFTDTFDDGSNGYVVHLYQTSADPVFSAPANTVAPALTTDGTPQSGETIGTSDGTWTGVPSPSFTYQWQRAGVDIAGATHRAYTLTDADVGVLVRCVVTAHNVQGDTSANSNAVTPAAAAGGGGSGVDYAPVVMADNPTGYWRLDDLTDETTNAHDLTVGAGAPVSVASLVGEAADHARNFTNDTWFYTTPDHSTLRSTANYTVEAWIKPAFIGATFRIAYKDQGYKLDMQGDGKVRFTGFFFGGNFYELVGDTALSINTVYHVACTWDGTTMKVYVNGVLDGSLVPSGAHAVNNIDTNALQIGKWFGILDEVAYYQTTLSAAQLLDHYEAGSD